MKKEESIVNEERPIWIHQDIKKVFQELYDHYRAVLNRNEYLEKEIARLKSEAYKDVELAKMKERYNKMHDDYYRGFPISEEQYKTIKEWEDEIIGDSPDMKINSARFIYEFYPTSLGIVGTVKDSITGKKLIFQELS